MDRDKLNIAIAEAKRFLERAKAADLEYLKFGNRAGGYWRNNDTKATGSIRRASMDLTRALADLRRPS